MTGKILKALSGFYYVLLDEDGTVLTCRGRGRLRHEKITPLVGDAVKLTRSDAENGMIDEILPRRNEFHRPAVANIDQLVMVASAAIPVTDPYLIDRLFSFAAHKEVEPVLLLNKWDLSPADDLVELYRNAGYRVYPVSAKTGEGMQALQEGLTGKISAFTGNSGVGKSSILNYLAPNMDIAVAEVSEKLGRGRHTTRHVELHKLPSGAIVADTPGFSSLDSIEIGKQELADTFLEFRPLINHCYFQDCAHVKEQGCRVLESLTQGEIAPSRHESYVRLYQEAAAVKDWQKS